MNRIHNLRLVAVLLLAAFTGCQQSGTDTTRDIQESTLGDNLKPGKSNDPAKYQFHRNVEFTDVTKNIPSGSVDHIDLNMAADPKVIVVVTVTAPPEDNLTFITTFNGANGLRIKKEWKPANSNDNEHVGLFVLPDAVTTGSTVVQ